MKKTLKKFTTVFFSVFLLVVFALNVSAEKYEDLNATNYVNDFADVLNTDEENVLNQRLKSLEEKTGYQVAVVTVKNMDGDYIEHYAVKLFEKWGIGGKEKDEGVLFLVSIEDRVMRMEVGYGLEPTLTDGITKNIQDNFVRPLFKEGNYSPGISVGVENMIKVLEGNAPEELFEENNQSDVDWLSVIIFALIFGVNILGWLFAIMARTKSWWLGGVVTFLLGLPILYFGFGFNLIGDIILVVTTLSGFLFDFFISKNYKYWQQKLPIDGGSTSSNPAWWAGGGWGPGGGSSGGSSFGGFGGGSSGGGGSSSSW